MTRKTVVMLSGKAGAGKDTFAEMLGSSWERVAFADALKEHCADFSGLDLLYFHDRDLKDTVIGILGDIETPRDLLIRMGRSGRELDPLCWVKPVIKRIRESSSEFFVVSDWRFPNEADALEEDLKDIADVLKVRIVGPGDNGSSDESECALDNSEFAYTVVNRDTKGQLERKAWSLGYILGEDDCAERLYGVVKSIARTICPKFTSGGNLNSWLHDTTWYAMEAVSKKYNFSCRSTTFVHTVITYKCLNLRKSRRVRHAAITFNTVVGEWFAGSFVFRDYLLADKLRVFVDSLPELQREVFELRFDWGYTHKQIAEKLGIKENYSRKVLFSARQTLMGLLEEEYLDIF